MPTPRRRPLSIASLLLASLALAGCAAPGSPGVIDPAPAAYSASPECDAYVAAKNDAISSANQQAVQVSVDELPFEIADEYEDAVLCVDAISALDATDDQTLGFEVLTDAVDGIGYNVFAMSPDLTYRTCETNEPLGCFTDAAGNLVVVGAADAARQFFPGLNAIVIGGVHMIGD